MAVYITAISPGTTQEHDRVDSIRWVNPADSTSRVMSIDRAVTWVREGHVFIVAGDDGPVEVQVVNADRPYLRTVANGKWADNLLALPRF